MARVYYINRANYVPGKGYERNLLPSQTVPNQTRTIKELVERLQLGLPIPDKKPQYMDIPLDEVDHLMQQAIDLTDLDELNDRIQSTKDYIEEALREKKKSQEAWEKAEAKRLRQEEINEAIRNSKLNAE